MIQKLITWSKAVIEKIIKIKFISRFISFLENLFKTEITTLIAELFKSTAVGGLGVIINLALYYLFTLLKTKGMIYKIIALVLINIINIIISFVLQKYYTFKKINNTGEQLIKFILQSLSYLLFDTLFTVGFEDWLHLPPMLAKFISVFILFFYSFLTQKLWIFKR